MTATLKDQNVELVSSRTVLTPASGFLSDYSHSLNPYMGCAWGVNGCGVYCYVAESPISFHDGRPWGQWVKAKVNAAEILHRELQRAPDSSSLRVFMSSATDPYQPAERVQHVTRSVLEVFRDQPIALLVVQTRSPLVERDLDLLAEMPFAWLSMTVETNDDDVRQTLTPTCPSIERRFETMRRVREAGVQVQAAVSPTLPHDQEQFVGLLREHADRVVVDTFAGDGSDGKRTARRPLPARFQDEGFGDWQDETAARALYESLVHEIGADRVGWSQEGFNALVRVELGPQT